MLRARSLPWIFLTLVILLANTATAQEQKPSEDECDWYCWVEEKIDRLEQKIDRILGVVFPNDNSEDESKSPPKAPTENNEPSITRFPSAFGTPKASITRPDEYEKTASHVIVEVSSAPTQTHSSSKPAPAVASREGYRAISYFGNWDVYARKYFPQHLPAENLTHVLYSFADNKDDGTVFLSDSYADTEIHYPGDSWSDSGNNVYGAMKQLALLKAANRNLKVLLSIGGWTYTNEKKHMDNFAASEEGRKRFASSCVDMIRDYGFDGVDVDWEYPQDTRQGAQFLALLIEIRKQLDDYAKSLVYGDQYGNEDKPEFLLSIAAPAGVTNYRNLPLREMAQVLDFINLMTYDFSGSWDQTSGHSSNLYPSKSNPTSTPFDTVTTVNAYLDAGVPSQMINLGMPLYGRAFTNTEGLGKPYNGVGAGTWEKGVYDYKDLPLDGAKEYYDEEVGATYSYDDATGMLVSYDTVDMALRKVDYIKKTKLGGAMWWEASGDRTDEGSIIANVVDALGGRDGSGIESSPNWLDYPDSRFDNIRNGVSS